MAKRVREEHSPRTVPNALSPEQIEEAKQEKLAQIRAHLREQSE